MALFPTCFQLTFAAPFLVLACVRLLPKPWPVAVADLPLRTTEEKYSPIDLGREWSGPKGSIEQPLTVGNFRVLTSFSSCSNCATD